MEQSTFEQQPEPTVNTTESTQEAIRPSGFTLEQEKLILKHRVGPIKRLGAIIIDFIFAFFISHLILTILGLGIRDIETFKNVRKESVTKKENQILSYNTQLIELNNEMTLKMDRLSRAEADQASILKSQTDSLKSELKRVSSQRDTLEAALKLEKETPDKEVVKLVNVNTLNILIVFLFIMYFDVLKGRTPGKWLLRFEIRGAYGRMPVKSTLFKRFLIKNAFSIISIFVACYITFLTDLRYTDQMTIVIFYFIYGFLSLIGTNNQGFIDKRLKLAHYPRKFQPEGIGEEK